VCDAVLDVAIWDYDAQFNFWWDGHDYIGSVDVLYRRLEPGTWVKFTEPLLTKDNHEQGSISFDVLLDPEV
jgi:hypothetical protein